MKKFLRKHLRKILLAFMIVIFIFSAYIAYAFYTSYQLRQAIQIEEDKLSYEREKQKEAEMTELKNKLIELENKPEFPPQIIYKTIEKTTEKIVETPTEITIADIVTKWSPLMVLITADCHSDDYSVVYEWGGSGSLTLIDSKDPAVVTNRHVLRYYDSFGNTECTADTINLHFSNGKTYTVYTDPVKTEIVKTHTNENIDMSIVYISNASTDIKDIITSRFQPYCTGKPAIGDKIVILGYPSIGATSGITATEGIISGYDGLYYVTSAKIEHGNSGGIAVLVKDNCVLGMPSASVVGSIESLGRILPSKIFTNL